MKIFLCAAKLEHYTYFQQHDANIKLYVGFVKCVYFDSWQWQRYSPLLNIQTVTWAHPASHTMCIMISEAGFKHPPSANIKNVLPLPHTPSWIGA